MQTSVLAYVLPPPPATLLFVVDMFGVQDVESVGKARAGLRTLGYTSVLILAQTEGVLLAHAVDPVLPLVPGPVSCPATAPHDHCSLCRGTGVVEAVDVLPP